MSPARKRAIAIAAAALTAAIAGVLLVVVPGGSADAGTTTTPAEAKAAVDRFRQCLEQNGVTRQEPSQGRPSFGDETMHKAFQACRQYLPARGDGRPGFGTPPRGDDKTTTDGREFATSTSSNWAGYAATSVDETTPVSFTSVSGAWRQPAATCTTGSPTYSAFWVGLGGYSDTSQALEQIGTSADCSASGQVSYSLWYELVPAVPVTITLPLRAGDSIAASVSVSGRSVTVRITNVTQKKRTFAKRLTMSSTAPDVSSAEWVAEAPSTCTTSGNCRVLPLANFGSVTFVAARATAAGHAGTISDPSWSAAAITLTGGGGSFLGRGRFGLDPNPADATPTPLSADGSSFAVTWSESGSTQP